VRDPAREKKSWPGLRETFRLERSIGKEITRVIERHNHHDDSAENIERDDARGGRSAIGGCNSRGRRQGGGHGGSPRGW
jgi:hypothetical protein